MTASAIVTMLVGMILIWGGLIASLLWAMRTDTKWGD